MSDVPDASGSGGLSRIPFTVAAENQLKSLSSWLTVVGWVNAFAAVGDIIDMLTQRNGGQLVNLLLHVGIATWSLGAARAFKNVATTDVADQAYLVQGFAKLRYIFLLQGVLILVGLAFFTAVLLFFLVARECPNPCSRSTPRRSSSTNRGQPQGRGPGAEVRDFCSTTSSSSISLAGSHCFTISEQPGDVALRCRETAEEKPYAGPGSGPEQTDRPSRLYRGRRRGVGRRRGDRRRAARRRRRTPPRRPQSAALAKRKLGKSGIEVSMLNIGTWRSSGVERLLRFAWANGVRYIDTAKSYGTEPADRPMVPADARGPQGTVPGHQGPCHGVAHGNSSSKLDDRLAALKTDYIDLIFIHALGDHDFATEVKWPESQEFKETAEAIRKSGKAKFVGFSTHHPKRPEILQAAVQGRVRRRDHDPEQPLDRPGRRHEPGPRRLLQGGHRADLDEAGRRQHEPRGDRPAAARAEGEEAHAVPGPAARDLDRRAVLLVLRLDAEHRPDPRERRGGADLQADDQGRARPAARRVHRRRADAVRLAATAGAARPPAPLPSWAT